MPAPSAPNPSEFRAGDVVYRVEGYPPVPPAPATWIIRRYRLIRVTPSFFYIDPPSFPKKRVRRSCWQVYGTPDEALAMHRRQLQQRRSGALVALNIAEMELKAFDMAPPCLEETAQAGNKR
jgi:hypothetical protein